MLARLMHEGMKDCLTSRFQGPSRRHFITKELFRKGNVKFLKEIYVEIKNLDL